jgi:hypothetical protein
MYKKEESTKETFVQAYENNAGNISLACKKANISRSTYYRWLKEDLEFQEKTDEVKEALIDLAETMLLKKIREGSTPELIFFLKTQGKKRGYIERVEHKIEDGIILDFKD